MSKKEILLVEDSRTQTVLMRRLLETAGFIVDAVLDGARAIEWFKTNNPRPVLTDVTMPELDGYELCSRLKKDSRFESVPIILLASLRGPEDLPRILASGADGFIYKEFESSYFIPLLNALLERKSVAASGADASTIALQLGNTPVTLSSNQLEGILISSFNTAVYCRTKLDGLV